MQLQFVTGDITKLHVDVIVNSANTFLKPGGGVCGAIHDAAGLELAKECAAIGSCQPGEAIITGAYNLPAKHVIHTVAPIYGQHHGNEPEILFSCYYESLRLAEAHQMTSIAFPSLGTGIYHYPKEEALEIAQAAVLAFEEDWPKSNIREVLLVHL